MQSTTTKELAYRILKISNNKSYKTETRKIAKEAYHAVRSIERQFFSDELSQSTDTSKDNS